MMKMVSLSEDDGMEIKMRKHLTILTAAAMTAVMLTACGSGDGIVINGTTAAESGIVAGETSGEQAEGNTPEETSKTGGTKIEIVTGETTAAVESLEGQTEPETTQEAGKMIISAETATTGTTAAATKAANPTTAALRSGSSDDCSSDVYGKRCEQDHVCVILCKSAFRLLDKYGCTGCPVSRRKGDCNRRSGKWLGPGDL